jgi:hypothetical protein
MSPFRSLLPFVALTVLGATGALAVGCSSDEEPANSSSSSGSAPPAQGSVPEGGGVDEEADGGDGLTGPRIKGCEKYQDRSGADASREITWDFSVTTAPERCMFIKVGQTVSWAGNLETHPLAVDDIAVDDLKKVAPGAQVTFTKPGTFGFECTFHTEMMGAIHVVE